MMLSMLLMLTILCCNVFTILCYNIDTHFPIVYEALNNKAYFGYTVQLQPGINAEDSWLHIGAPNERASYNASMNPGVVYRCPIRGICQSLPGERDETNGEICGFSMDYQITTNTSVSCSPRRLFQLNMAGSCWVRKPGRKNRIRETEQKQILQPFTDRHTIYKNSSLAGFSVHLTKDKSIIIGAPGATGGRGAVALSTGEFTRKDTRLYTDSSTHKNGFVYLGYAVNSGRFINKKTLHYVASAPQYGNNYRTLPTKGQVKLFNIAGQKITIVKTLNATQLGEYFGSSLAVADVTGDGLDDLIVGAPTWSSKEDEGRVYVFVGDSSKILRPATEGAILEGVAEGGRFGSVVQSLGHLDYDAYEDVAVGAPYEDDRGAVYIYYGSSTGLTNDRRVRIAASSFSFINLQGFGISISRGQDIDGNGYNDLAVGSFISGHVVLLRGRPVVDVKLKFINSTSSLNEMDRTLNFTTCITISNKNTRRKVSLLDTKWNRIITADETLNRVENKSLALNKQIDLKEGQEHCEYVGFAIKNNDSNVIESIDITVNYELIDYFNAADDPVLLRGNSFKSDPDGFKPLFPVTYSRRNGHTLAIPLNIGCGEDHICRSDLRVDTQFIGVRNNSWSYGSKSTISLHIDVENFGEVAHLPKLVVHIPHPVYLGSGACQSLDSEDANNVTNVSVRIYECNLGSKVERNQKKNVSIVLDMINVQRDNVNEKETLEFFVNVSTKSFNNSTRSSNSVLLQLKTEVDIGISGGSSKEFYEENKNDTSDLIDFQHYYQVRKLGSSSVDEVELKIRLPMKIKNVDGLEMKVVQMKSFHEDFQCSLFDPNASQMSTSEETENDCAEQNEELRKLRTKRETQQSKIQEHAEPFIASLDNQIFQLNCSNAQCFDIICTGNLKTDFAKLYVQMSFNKSLIKQLLKKENVILLSTEASVKIISPNVTQSSINGMALLLDDVTISTRFILTQKIAVVEKWVIILSVATGLILFILLFFILVQLGFFKRKRVPIDSIEFEETVELRSKISEEDGEMQDIDLKKEVVEEEDVINNESIKVAETDENKIEQE